MTTTPLLEDTRAGKLAKKISDGLFLDAWNSRWVLSLVREFEDSVREDALTPIKEYVELQDPGDEA